MKEPNPPAPFPSGKGESQVEGLWYPTPTDRSLADASFKLIAESLS